MPPKTKISREMIVDASLEVIRKEGHENLNARNIANAVAVAVLKAARINLIHYLFLPP